MAVLVGEGAMAQLAAVSSVQPMRTRNIEEMGFKGLRNFGAWE
jgi:hypothetical protein